MSPSEILILNFNEIRRRSLKLWTSVTPDIYDWRPDKDAMSCIEMVRHVLESEHIYHIIVSNRGNLGTYISPWEGKPYNTVQDEIDFALPYRGKFLAAIGSFSAEDLDSIEIIRPEKGQRRKLGDYLLRIGYHEAVHTGQMLDYLRTIGVGRPLIWD
ncbi:MAG TPA: DinB family protein [Mucilaginibacter sp.]|nr:DinB family protein [Mucilaginibacter sp.]